MKIFFSPYALKFKNTCKFRKGALIKIDFGENIFGYADCHPWVELGDLPLEKQLEFLSLDQLTPLTKQTVKFAYVDAYNTKPIKSIPPSHALFMSLDERIDIQKIIKDKITRIKIKIDQISEERIEVLIKLLKKIPCQNELKIRLDFNGKGTLPSIKKLSDRLESFHHFIDFYEDPFPKTPEEHWEKFKKEYPISLASDRHYENFVGKEHLADILVIKPAKDQIEILGNTQQKIVVTSYLDHPIGQCTAAYTAEQIANTYRLEICGLNSHTVYEDTPFTPNFDHISNPGWGFQPLLSKLTWQPLNLASSLTNI